MQRLGSRAITGILLAVSAYGQSGQTERLTLDITFPQAVASVEAGEVYRLSSATAAVEREGRWVAIYRWLLSAADTDRIEARLTGDRWEALPGGALALPPGQAISVHSPQTRGGLQIVLLDLVPWRMSGGQLQVLREGRVEVTIRHRSHDALAGPGRPAFPTTRLVNQVLVAAPPRKSRIPGVPLALPSAGESWLKIPLQDDGIYQLTGSYLSEAGVALSTLDVEAVKLFVPGHLGRPMNDAVGAPFLENLVELPILVRDGGDGVLDAGDDILFYGQGPRGFDLAGKELAFRQNPYTDTAHAWLQMPPSGGGPPGARIASGPPYSPSGPVLTSGRTRTRREVDIFNGFDSGPHWHEAAIRRGSGFAALLATPALRTSDTTRLWVRLRGGNDRGSHQVSLSLNQVALLTSAVWTAHRDITLAPGPSLIATAVATDQNIISLDNVTSNSDPQEEVWMDWVELSYGIDLVAGDGALTFLLPALGAATVIGLTGFSTEPTVLDISDPAAPVRQQLQQSGDQWLFALEAVGVAQRYAAATDAALRTPGPATYYDQLDFTSLRRPDLQADYIIITADALLSAARELAAIHSQEVRPTLRLTTLVTTVNDIYREFSGGMTDPFALRAFLRWARENWLAPAPILVALFGDGDFDYRNLSGLSRNLVPTIQVDGSSEITSRTADDRFVYLDSVAVGSPLPAMGIGRIAAATPDEAEAVLAAVRSYMVTPEPGSWRLRVLLAADDTERPNTGETFFVAESEWATGMLPPYLRVSKIYLTEYPEVLDPATNTVVKPDGTAALINIVNQGVALINYVGHGSATQWAQEQLLKMDRDRSLLLPGNRLPVWFAGTCTWGRFDQLDSPSMSEVLTVSSEYAAIGVISAVRSVFASANFRFIRDLFTASFPDRSPAPLRIGQILQNAKGGGDSDEKFHLFGDPAILMAFPRDPLSLNAVAPDTLMVLSTATYSGSTVGGAISAGEALVTVLDAPRTVTRSYRSLAGDARTITYSLPGGPIFRGAATISGGAFQGQFVVPRDINYSGNPASLIAYGWSAGEDLLVEQIGHRNDLVIRGTAAAVLDSVGPLAALYWNERTLVTGDVLPLGAELVVELQDPLGINLTGEVGHAVRLWVDDEIDAQIVDHLFQYDIDSHTTGRFAYRFDPALSGAHSLNVEAWDGANNKTLRAWNLQLTLEEALDVADLFNYPNPFDRHTEFVYTLSTPAEVKITVFTLNGVKVVSLSSMGTQGHGFQRLPWDGTDHFGDQVANGAYLYLFSAEADGQTITRWGRLARLR